MKKSRTPMTRGVFFGVNSTSGATINSISCQPVSGMTGGFTTSFSTPLPASSVIVTLTKNVLTDSGSFNCTVTQTGGPTLKCDPWSDDVTRVKAKPGTITVDKISGTEGHVTVYNDTPGISQLELSVNGQKFKLTAMRDGQTYTLDISTALQPGTENSTVYLTVKGKPDGSAYVVIAAPTSIQ